MAFYLPDAHAQIDWTQEHSFVETALRQVVRDAELGKRHADALVRVTRHNGAEQWVCIQIEVQGQRDADFAKRMFTFAVLDWMMRLPERLAQQRWQAIRAHEGARRMRYVTSVERIGRRIGWREGHLAGQQAGERKGKAEDLGRLLARRFGPLPDWASARIQAAPIAQLDAWLDGIVDAHHLEARIGPKQQG